MPVRTPYAGAAVAGEVLTAANVNKIPGGWIGYAEVTTSQGPFGAATDLTGLSIAITAGTNRRLRISCHVLLSSSVAGDIARLDIMEGATTLNLAHGYMTTSAASVCVTAVITPTSGAHTYKLQAQRAAGGGGISTFASASAPNFILVEDIGPAT
jgi:hypothetical protein